MWCAHRNHLIAVAADTRAAAVAIISAATAAVEIISAAADANIIIFLILLYSYSGVIYFPGI